MSGMKIPGRKSYPQNWRAYNAAQTNEKAKFQLLLYDLCQGLPEGPIRLGRRRLSMADTIFCIAFKVYSTLSGRRFTDDLKEAHKKGYLTKVPHYNSLFRYFENPELTPVLRQLVQQSSLPLKEFEVDFAVDSSGFSTSRFIQWYHVKYGAFQKQHSYIKAHIMCGVKTNVVTAIEITDANTGDVQLLPELVNATGANFTIQEVSADKAYGSQENMDVIAGHAAVPYIPFKTNHTGSGGGMWQKMFYYFMLNQKEYLAHYHKRSNVESVFAMIKAKFRDHVRSRNTTAMYNEAYAKFLCHNICCLIQEMYELGIEPKFWGLDERPEPLPA